MLNLTRNVAPERELVWATIDLCGPKRYGFQPFWSYIGYRVCSLCLHSSLKLGTFVLEYFFNIIYKAINKSAS